MINVIIPCYNSTETLPKTLDSLVAQTQSRFLVTVVDDYSEENMLKIVNDYEDRLNISYLRLTENGGPGVARQAGIDNNSMCEYLMFLDADDMLMPQAIEVLNREANKNKPDILVSAFIQQNKYGIDRIVHSTETATWVHGKVYSCSFLRNKNIHFPERLRINEDGAFNTMALNMTNNIYRTSVITVLWVDNKNSLTRKDRDFIVTCIPSYIEGQVYAYNFLLDNIEIVENLHAGLAYIYNYYQVMDYNKLSLSEKAEKELGNFLLKIKNLGYFKEKSFRKGIIKTLCDKKNTFNYDYFEKATFEQWLKKYGVDLNENNSN